MAESAQDMISYVKCSMMSLPACPDISTREALKILQQLAQQQQRLATDAAYFSSQRPDVQTAVTHFIELGNEKPGELKKVLQTEPRLFKWLATVAAAALDQLSAQLDSNIELGRTVMALGVALSMLVSLLRDKRALEAPATPAESAHLQVLHDTGKSGQSFNNTCTRAGFNERTVLTGAKQVVPD